MVMTKIAFIYVYKTPPLPIHVELYILRYVQIGVYLGLQDLPPSHSRGALYTEQARSEQIYVVWYPALHLIIHF